MKNFKGINSISDLLKAAEDFNIPELGNDEVELGNDGMDDQGILGGSPLEDTSSNTNAGLIISILSQVKDKLKSIDNPNDYKNWIQETLNTWGTEIKDVDSFFSAAKEFLEEGSEDYKLIVDVAKAMEKPKAKPKSSPKKEDSEEGSEGKADKEEKPEKADKEEKPEKEDKEDKPEKKDPSEMRKESAINMLSSSKRVKLTPSIREAMDKIDNTTYRIKIAKVDIEWKIEMRDGVPWLRRVSKPQDIIDSNEGNRNV